MNPKDFLILHGEKLALVLVGALCLYLFVDAFTNADIRPRAKVGDSEISITAAKINGDINAITEFKKAAKPPMLKPPADYLAKLKGNLASGFKSKPFIAPMSVHPDRGPEVGEKRPFVYIHELLPPMVEVKDAIGSVQLSFSLPEPIRGKGGDRELSDASKATWTRTTPEKVTNSVELVGLLVEMKKDGDKEAWQPVKGPGVVQGVLPIDRIGEPLTVEGLSAWETFQFRARSVLKATGFDFDSPGAGTVLVHQGRVVPEDQPFNGWTEIETKLAAKDEAVRKRFLNGTPDGSERTYQSLPGEPVSIVASSSIRFALLKFEPDAANAGQDIATVLLTMYMRDKDGQGFWLKKPEKFEVRSGEKLGGERDIDIPTDEPTTALKPADLSTPFELVKLEKDVPRVFYYEIKPKARATPGKDKDLEVVPKEGKADVAIFKNSVTKQPMTLIKLGRVSRPGNTQAVIYPDFKANVDEKAEFEKAPGEFLQWGLKPPEPLAHQPGGGPLDELRKRGSVLAATDTVYYELPDGRLVWWEPRNHKLEVRYKLGKEPKAADAPADVKPEEDPAEASADPAASDAAPDAAAPKEPVKKAGAK